MDMNLVKIVPLAVKLQICFLGTPSENHLNESLHVIRHEGFPLNQGVVLKRARQESISIVWMGAVVCSLGEENPAARLLERI